MKSIRTNQEQRKGTATVEAAVCLPLLLTLVFGSVEAANAVFLKQSLTIAAYEAAKAASGPQGTKTFATQRAEEALDVRDVENYTISFSPEDITTSTARGTQISVTVSASADASALGPLWIFSGSTMTKTVTMVRL